jgi:hypothetical protein
VALTQQFAAGEDLTAAKLNASSIPVVSSTANITTPFTGQIIFNTTDTRTYRYTGSAWAAFSGGPVWSLSRVAAQGITNSAWNSMLWDTDRVDTDNMHSTVTNTDRVTITQAGLYAVTSKGSNTPNATGLRGCRITLNGVLDASAVEGSSVIVNNVGGTFTTSIPLPTLYIQCIVGDILRVQQWQNSGGTLNTSTSSAADYPLFTGAWLRD